MGKSNFSEEFKRDAVRQITERGYPVAEVSQRRVCYRQIANRGANRKVDKSL